MGEIVARSDGVMQGYWQQPAATAEAMRGGWFHTGDMATISEDGRILIADRKKDIIVSGGEKISSPQGVKAHPAQPPGYEAALIPIPHQKTGAVPPRLAADKHRP